eukprot:198360_1
MANARSNSKSRKSTKDDTRDECTITDHDVFHMLEKQMFRCKYSGIPMTFYAKTDWKCSLERKDNMKGYTKDNCVLICWEFNSSDRTSLAKSPLRVQGSSQWNEEKFKYFYKTRL